MCAARHCLKTPVLGPIPRVRLRADSHMPASQCCAARNLPPIVSQRRLVAPASRQLGATPPKNPAALPHWGRAPTHATVPLGGRPPLNKPFSRGEADPESPGAADVHEDKPCPARPHPPQVPTMCAAFAWNGICGHSRPHADEYQISRRLCDRQRTVCLSAIVPIGVLDPRLDTTADGFGSQNVRKCKNVCPNVSGMVGEKMRTSCKPAPYYPVGLVFWPTRVSDRRSGSRRW